MLQGNQMSVTESDMNVLREMLVDVAGAMGKAIADQLGAQIGAFEKSVAGQFVEVNGRIDGLAGQVGQVLDRLTVVEGDISAMRAQLAGLARMDVQRRLEKLEARLAALEEARQ
jgi:hypothetical protein